MSENSKSTRTSQWKSYFEFCLEFGFQDPLPASLDMMLLYVVHLADRLQYKSIQQYLGAVWILHEMSGLGHVDPYNFELMITMRGIKRSLGDTTKQARPATLLDLVKIFHALDLSVSQDLAFWVALLLGFRALLRKSNLVEVDMSIKISDITWESWGLGISVRRTKTISFNERILYIPLVPIPASIFCVHYYLARLYSSVNYPKQDSQLIGYMSQGKYVRASYGWYSKKLSNLCVKLDLVMMSTHSMRRGGASLLAENGVSLVDIKNLGDWKSASVLYYLTRTLDSKVTLERDIVRGIYQNPAVLLHD